MNVLIPILIMWAIMAAPLPDRPKYKDDDCFVEDVSKAIVCISRIAKGYYYYNVHMFNDVIEERAKIKEFESRNQRLLRR